VAAVQLPADPQPCNGGRPTPIRLVTYEPAGVRPSGPRNGVFLIRRSC
jgi:hypothetical protein